MARARSRVCVWRVIAAVMLRLAPSLGLTGVWLGLGLLMLLRAALAAARIASRTGPWDALRAKRAA
eukprot:61815-Pleurochrysis_carterae.AAC.2